MDNYHLPRVMLTEDDDFMAETVRTQFESMVSEVSPIQLPPSSDLMLQVVSDNSSSIDSQDEQDFQMQEKILKHLVEPQRLMDLKRSYDEYDEGLSPIQIVKNDYSKLIKQDRLMPRGNRSQQFWTMKRENQTKYRLDSPNEGKYVYKQKKEKSSPQSEFKSKMTKLEQVPESRKQPSKLEYLNLNGNAFELINNQQILKKKIEHEEYLSKLEQNITYRSSQRLQALNGMDPEDLLTQRHIAIKKRNKVMLYRQGLKICEIIYQTLSENHNLGCKEMIKFTLMNKKLNHILNVRNSLYFMGTRHRLKFYIQKCSLFDKQIEFIKKEMNLNINNEENEGKYIYNYIQDIVFDRIKDPNQNIETAIPPVVADQIKVDLARTNTTMRVKTKEGQDELERVLRAIAYLFPQVAYCQGMNFIVSVILHITQDREYLALLIFIHFLSDRNLKMESLFYSGLPELHVMNYTFEKMIQKYCPKLFLHFKSTEMKTEYFTFKWSMTLFSCSLPWQILLHIFDLFVIDGWPVIYKIGVSLLNNFVGPQILQMDNMMDINLYFRDNLRFSSTFTDRDIHAIIMGSHAINITQQDLLKLKEDFYIELAQEKMKQQFSQELSVQQPRISIPSPNRRRKPNDEDYAEEVLIQAKIKLESMDPHAKEDIHKFQEKLRKVDKQLDRYLKEKMEKSKEYKVIKEEYTQAISKKKALQKTFMYIMDQYDKTLQQMAKLQLTLEDESKFHAMQSMRNNGFVSSQKTNNFLLIEKTMKEIQFTQGQIDTQEQELTEMNLRLKNLQVSLDLIKQNYIRLRKLYYLNKIKLEEQIHYKERIASQMNGFLLMYELKRHQTYKELSENLKKTERFKKEHQF